MWFSAQALLSDQPELAIGAISEGGNTILSGWAAEVDPCYINAEKYRKLSILCDRRGRIA